VQPHRFYGKQHIVERFRAMQTAGKLGQTFLFIGPDGSGKETTALEIARVFNCSAPAECRPESLCESCQKVATFQHPDVRWIGPAPAALDENDVRKLLVAKQDNPFFQPPFALSAQVSIGDPENPRPLTIRSLIKFLRLRSFQGEYKVAIVADCHRMTQNAANAFLKTLEEPPPSTLVFLLTSNAGSMLPTIRSRCQKVQFSPYPAKQMTEIMVELGQESADHAIELARIADGNARRAMASILPQNQALRRWGSEIFKWIHTGRPGAVHQTADQLHGGLIPEEFSPTKISAKKLVAKEPVEKRERAILLCEMLNLYYSEALVCCEQQQEWVPRLDADADRVRKVASQRHPNTLIQDIACIEATKHEIDHNLNIGLSLAVLFQGLIDNVKFDQSTR